MLQNAPRTLKIGSDVTDPYPVLFQMDSKNIEMGMNRRVET